MTANELWKSEIGFMAIIPYYDGSEMCPNVPVKYTTVISLQRSRNCRRIAVAARAAAALAAAAAAAARARPQRGQSRLGCSGSGRTTTARAEVFGSAALLPQTTGDEKKKTAAAAAAAGVAVRVEVAWVTRTVGHRRYRHRR